LILLGKVDQQVVEREMHTIRRGVHQKRRRKQRRRRGRHCYDDSGLYDEVSEVRQHGDETETGRPVQVRAVRLEAVTPSCARFLRFGSDA
jgi:type IV pilus biogenesis protein CpaD/CtpE